MLPPQAGGLGGFVTCDVAHCSAKVREIGFVSMSKKLLIRLLQAAVHLTQDCCGNNDADVRMALNHVRTSDLRFQYAMLPKMAHYHTLGNACKAGT